MFRSNFICVPAPIGPRELITQGVPRVYTQQARFGINHSAYPTPTALRQGQSAKRPCRVLHTKLYSECGDENQRRRRGERGSAGELAPDSTVCGKRTLVVILSEAKNLSGSKQKAQRDSSGKIGVQNDEVPL